MSNLKLGNWSESDPGVVGGLSYVVVGEGKYATGLEDLATWNVVPVAGSPTLWDVIRGPDRFVLLGSYLTIVLVDGQAPVETVDAEQYPIKGCYEGGWYWRVTNSADRIQKSVDGISWTNVAVDLNGEASLCIAAEGALIAVSGNRGRCAVSTDGGLNWAGKAVGSDTYAQWTAGVHGSRVFFATREQDVPYIYYADAPYTTWSTATAPLADAGNAPVAIAFSGSLGVLPYGGYWSVTSDNGVNWTHYTVASGPNLDGGLLFDGTRFVLATTGPELETLDASGVVRLVAHTFDFNLRSVAFKYTEPIPPTSGSGTHDLIVLPNGRAETTESLAQRVDVRLRTFIGEHWLNPELGVPWFEEFLRKAPDLASCRQILVAVSQDVLGVVAVDSLEVGFDKNSRQLRVSFAVSGSDSIPQSGLTAVPL